jgi:hypothetical protein
MTTGSERPAPSFQSDAEIVNRPDALGTDTATSGSGAGSARAGESATLRDPFWPIGYSPVVPGSPQTNKSLPKATARVEQPPKWDDALKSLEVRGIMKTSSGSYVAIVDGQVASEQEVISKSFLGKTYTWRITSISKAGIKFVRESVSR